MSTREEVAEQLSRTSAGLVPGAMYKTPDNARAVVDALRYLVQNTPELADVITEHGIRGNQVGLTLLDKDFERDYGHPVPQYIDHQLRMGRKVYQRKIIVLGDWTEATE